MGRPRSFDREASLEVLKTLAERYKNRFCICGIGVANEPSDRHSTKDLMDYYVRAQRTVREAGMSAGTVAVLLPLFREHRLKAFLEEWEKNYTEHVTFRNPKLLEDVVFDLHFYQCFGPLWETLSRETQMKEARNRASILKQLPASCITEWSLALPLANACTDLQMLEEFAEAQLEAYEQASHGWFFWTWKDQYGLPWCMKDCLAKGVLKIPEAPHLHSASSGLPGVSSTAIF